ncbi:unnamed protein product [Dicrocoelium dendriticum]|nr:unnamed protein product [Dicrocoelium dendriticum]
MLKSDSVPDVLVTLDTSDPVDSALLTIPPNLANRVRWAKGQSLDENTWRLVPKIYTTPTVLTASGVQLSLDSPASELLTICVTFVSPNSHSQGLALAALVGLSRAALLSSSLWGSSSFDLDRSLTLVPLELGSLAQSNPPYLLSSPVLVSEPLMHSAFSSPSTFSMLVTTFSGRLYKVPLPLGRDTSTPDVLWNFTGQSSVSLSCVPVDCPPKSSSASTSSNFLSESRLCCLLLDDSSHLRLIDISPLDKRAKHPSARLRWEYSPEPGTAPVDSLSQLGHSTLVPIDCDNRPHVTCHLWVVYPTTDGSVHAVDFNTGTPVDGYPVKLFVPEKPDSGNAFSMGLRTFASGPGLLYTAPDSSLWMLFADTLGWFYHVQMRTNPIVLTSGKCLFGCENKPDRRVYPVNTWITPVPIVHKSPWSPLQGQMAFLVTNTSGLGLLTVDRSLDPFTLGQPSSHGSYNFHTFDAVFLDNRGQPVDVIHMDPNQQSVRYALRNCLSWSIASGQLDYAVRLVDSSGLPISDWSTHSAHSSSIQYAPDGNSYCLGTLALNRPVYGSFRGRVHLVVIQTRTGRLLSSSSHAHPYAGVSSSVILDFHTSWPHVLCFWTYLPLVYVILGFLSLQLFCTEDQRFSHRYLV